MRKVMLPLLPVSVGMGTTRQWGCQGLQDGLQDGFGVDFRLYVGGAERRDEGGDLKPEAEKNMAIPIFSQKRLIGNLIGRGRAARARGRGVLGEGGRWRVSWLTGVAGFIAVSARKGDREGCWRRVAGRPTRRGPRGMHELRD